MGTYTSLITVTVSVLSLYVTLGRHRLPVKGLPVLAGAGSLRVGPTRLDLSAQRPVAVLEVQNSGPAPTLVQVDLLDWSQDGRGDVLTPTRDLVATPLVLNLASGESRVIRVGLRTANRSDAERSYRLFVREVPAAFSDGANLKFAVRIGVPIFAAPSEAQRHGGQLAGGR